MSDLGPTSDLEGKQGEEAAKAAPENKRETDKAAKRETVEEDHSAKPERKRRTRSPEHQAVTGKTDPVYLSRAEFESRKTRKSLTVHHIQRRLVELGYTQADSDPDGWLSVYTRAAIAEFQTDQLIDPADGNVTPETFESLFEHDGNVTLRFDA